MRVALDPSIPHLLKIIGSLAFLRANNDPLDQIQLIQTSQASIVIRCHCPDPPDPDFAIHQEIRTAPSVTGLNEEPCSLKRDKR